MCENNLTIKGNPEDIRDIKYFLFNTDNWLELSFEKFIPIPQNYKAWEKELWGCEGDALKIDEPTITEKEISIKFHTSWKEPDVWLRILSEKFPFLSFSLDYKNEKEWYIGTLSVKDGKVKRLWKD